MGGQGVGSAAVIRPEISDREHRDRLLSGLETLLSSWCTGGELGAIARHVLATPGKRLRARMTLAVAALGRDDLGALDEDALRAAAAVELLHEASLVHDDVCDRSPLRRGAPSVAAAFGMRTAVRFGLWLAARGLALIGELERRRGLGLAFAPLTTLAAGQLLESLPCGGDVAARRANYLAVVRAKTGALVQTACDLGARIAGVSDDVRAALAGFADAYGIAYQILDDVRDLESPPSLGKQGGTDLTNELWTWPLLEWLGDRDGDAAPAVLDEELRALTRLPLPALRAELARTGALQRARGFAQAELARGRRALYALPSSAGRAWLLELCGGGAA